MLKPMDMELIFSVISRIAVIAAVLIFSVPFLITFLFVFLPWIGFTQFWNVDTKDIEETILKNQFKRLLKETGMTFPPYTARFQEPTTDLNGSFYGVIFIKFNELLKEDFLAELEKRIKKANPCSLWKDRKLSTTMILALEKDRHYMYLNYSRTYLGEQRHGGFDIKDNRNVQPWDAKSYEGTSGGFGKFGVFSGLVAKNPSQESEETPMDN